MGEVKSAFEKAMEKIKEIQGFTPEEKEEMQDREKLKSVLAAFYRGELNKDQIWQELKGIRPSLLKEAQLSMSDSLRLGSSPEEFRQRREGILAVEALKERQNTAAIENILSAIGKLQREYVGQKEKAVMELRAAMEENPHLRLRQVKTPDGRVMQVAMPVEEAVQVRMSEFLADHEKRYEAMFNQSIARLSKELK